MKPEERTLLVSKAISYINSNCKKLQQEHTEGMKKLKTPKAKSHTKKFFDKFYKSERECFITFASNEYGVKLSTIRMILGE